jgi:hypothetical protein
METSYMTGAEMAREKGSARENAKREMKGDFLRITPPAPLKRGIFRIESPIEGGIEGGVRYRRRFSDRLLALYNF